VEVMKVGKNAKSRPKKTVENKKVPRDDSGSSKDKITDFRQNSGGS
jgi:hypothetical protein